MSKNSVPRLFHKMEDNLKRNMALKSTIKSN
jgi:hypothetical protein